MDAIGTLRYDDFRIAAAFLVDKWRTVINPDQPPWTWISPNSAASTSASAPHNEEEEEEEVGGYLALDKYMCPFEPPIPEERANIDENDCFTDVANLVPQHDLNLHYYDLHIVYSDSYRVPVLYFRAYTDDGSPLCMEDIEKDLPPVYAKQLSDSKWTFITQEEHPYLNRPWYKLHPCGTCEWMKLLYDGGSLMVDRNRIGTKLYLVLWLAVVGPMVGLKMPIEARKRLVDEAVVFKSQ